MPDKTLWPLRENFMSLMDAATFVLGTSLVMIIFVAKTNLEKSRVRVKVKIRK